MAKYTVFFEQINRTNFQVTAENEEEASAKARKLYRQRFQLPPAYPSEGWIDESDGEDK